MTTTTTSPDRLAHAGRREAARIMGEIASYGDGDRRGARAALRGYRRRIENGTAPDEFKAAVLEELEYIATRLI